VIRDNFVAIILIDKTNLAPSVRPKLMLDHRFVVLLKAAT